MSDHLQWQTSLKCIVIKLHLTVRFSFLSSVFNKGLYQGEKWKRKRSLDSRLSRSRYSQKYTPFSWCLLDFESMWRHWTWWEASHCMNIFRRCCYEICGSWSLLNTKLACQAMEQVTNSVPCLESLSFGHREDGCFIVFFLPLVHGHWRRRDKGQVCKIKEGRECLCLWSHSNFRLYGDKCKCIVSRFHSHCCQNVLFKTALEQRQLHVKETVWNQT